MNDTAHGALPEAVHKARPPTESELFDLLHGFTAARMDTAAVRAGATLDALAGGETERARRELRAFLRECWDALDGLGREVNLCMHHLFPEAGLYPPLQMTRQCTFYMVRKKLHEHPATADHPVSRLLWGATRAEPGRGYERLSFLYNVSLFVPLPVPEGRRLPGRADLPQAVRGLVKPGEVPPCEARKGLRQIQEWLETMVGECYGRMTRALSAAGDATR